MPKNKDTELFKMGKKVEVASNIKGLRNSWYKATIIPPPKSNSSSIEPRNKSLWVEYETLFDNEDPSKKLQEFTDTLLIRPLPPIPSKESNKFEKFDFVDVYYKDGWFTGVLLHVFDNGSKYLVAFLNPYEEFVYGKDQIRVHFQWLGAGKWRKVYPSQKVNVTFCPPKVGETVAASLPEPTPAIVSHEEQAPSLAKKLKRIISNDPKGRASSDRNYVVRPLVAPQTFLQHCSLPSSKGDTYCNAKSNASDGLNYSSSSFNPKKVLYRKVGKSGSAPSYIHPYSSKTKGSPNPFTNKSTSGETIGTAHPSGAPDPMDRFFGSILLDPMKKHSLLSKTSSRPGVLPSPSATVASLLESTSAVVRPVENSPSPAKKVKLTTSGYDAEERPSSDRNNDLQSVDAPQRFLHPCPLPSNKGNAHCDGKRKASDGQNYTSLPFSPNNNVAICAPNGGETVVASLLGSTPVVVSPVEQGPSPAKKLKQTNSAILSLLAKDQEDNNKNDAHWPAKGNQVTQMVDTINEPKKVIDDQDSQTRSQAKGNQVSKLVDIINKQVKVKVEQGIRDCGSKAPISSLEPEATERPKACPVTTCFSPKSDKSQSWPFTKKSGMWKAYESMEVFKRIPQAPHFSPLNEQEENSREKLALGMMSNFSYEAERISAGSPDDLNTSRIILGSLKSLEELESHGFNITPLQDYLTELLSKMEEEKELKGDLEEIESGIIKCLNEKTTIEVKLSALGKQLKSVQEQIQLEMSMKYLKDRQLANLESHRDIVSRKLHSVQLTKRPPFEW